MIVVDASALLAIVLDEPERREFIDAIGNDSAPFISAANWLEAAIVVDNHPNPQKREAFEEVVSALRVETVSISVEDAAYAREAHRVYGRGNHRARLNLGDCFAYALAKRLDAPLLFKGNDFAQTDVKRAL